MHFPRPRGNGRAAWYDYPPSMWTLNWLERSGRSSWGSVSSSSLRTSHGPCPGTGLRSGPLGRDSGQRTRCACPECRRTPMPIPPCRTAEVARGLPRHRDPPRVLRMCALGAWPSRSRRLRRPPGLVQHLPDLAHVPSDVAGPLRGLNSSCARAHRRERLPLRLTRSSSKSRPATTPSDGQGPEVGLGSEAVAEASSRGRGRRRGFSSPVVGHLDPLASSAAVMYFSASRSSSPHRKLLGVPRRVVQFILAWSAIRQTSRVCAADSFCGRTSLSLIFSISRSRLRAR